MDAGLECPGTPMQAAGNVPMLWRADLDDPGTLERGLISPVAWNEASLHWLVLNVPLPSSDDEPMMTWDRHSLEPQAGVGRGAGSHECQRDRGCDFGCQRVRADPGLAGGAAAVAVLAGRCAELLISHASRLCRDDFRDGYAGIGIRIRITTEGITAHGRH